MANNFLSLPDFLIGFIGGGTWNVAAHQRFVVPSIAILCCLVVLVSVVLTCWRNASSNSRGVSVLVALSGIFWILAIHQANSYYIGKQIQPRYLLPVFIAALLILGRDCTCRPSLQTSLLIAGMASVGHAALYYQHLRRYVVGLREWTNDDLGCLACSLRPIEWWWSWQRVPSPEVLWVTGSISFTFVAWFLVRPTAWTNRQLANLLKS